MTVNKTRVKMLPRVRTALMNISATALPLNQTSHLGEAVIAALF